MKHETRNTKHVLVASICGVFGKVIFLAAMSGGSITLAYAQVQFPIGFPAPKVGDTAKYRTVDLWNNKELSTSQTELVEIQNDRFVTRFMTSTDPAPRTVYFTREWQPCRAMRNSDQTVCAGSFKFPMQLGNKHTYEKLPWTNGDGHSTATCEVKAEEKVSVPVGAFDTVRIECAGFWNRVFNGNFSGRQTEVYWYAPTIGRLVKSQFMNFTSSGSPFDKTQTELVELTAGK